MGAIRWGLACAAMLVLAGCVGYGYPLGGAYPSGGGYYGQGYPDYGDGGYYGGGRTVRCESNDDRTRHCNADTRGGVRLSRQLSDTRCVQGRNWGYDRSGIWVGGGCRAEFVLGTGGGYYPGTGGGYGQTLRCESNDNRTRRCNADIRGGVRLSRQLSDTRCVQGRNWGYDRDGIWVSGGCRAEFTLGTGGGYYPGTGGGHGQTLRCESRDERQRRCNVPVRSSVQLVRQLSDTRCVQGRNWGWDRSGIWVSGGCRAEFSVR